MSSKFDISIDIGHIIPHGNNQTTAQVIGLWQQLGKLVADCDFKAAVPSKSGSRQLACHLCMDTEPVLNVLAAARDSGGSFDAYRLKHAADATLPVGCTLTLKIGSDDSIDALAAFEVAVVFLQQVVLAMNIAKPGSIQLLNTTFRGDQAHQVEAPVFDAIVFTGAHNAWLDHDWPALAPLDLAAVWQWLEACGTSTSVTAIKSIDKVLFTLLKIAEQRQDYSARMVLMVLFQLEVLLDCRNEPTYKPLRNRIREILGDIPEAADCLKDLYQVRGSLFGGDQPVRRPGLIRHSATDEIRQQLDQHDTMVELGVLLTIALLQDLVSNGAVAYQFGESVSRVS